VLLASVNRCEWRNSTITSGIELLLLLPPPPLLLIMMVVVVVMVVFSGILCASLMSLAIQFQNINPRALNEQVPE
jgi:hypothetical protein